MSKQQCKEAYEVFRRFQKTQYEGWRVSANTSVRTHGNGTDIGRVELWLDHETLGGRHGSSVRITLYPDGTWEVFGSTLERNRGGQQ